MPAAEALNPAEEPHQEQQPSPEAPKQEAKSAAAPFEGGSLEAAEKAQEERGREMLKTQWEKMDVEAQTGVQEFKEQSTGWLQRVKGFFKREKPGESVPEEAVISQETKKADDELEKFRAEAKGIIAGGNVEEIGALERKLTADYDTLAAKVAEEGAADSKAMERALKTGEMPEASETGAKLNETYNQLTKVRRMLQTGEEDAVDKAMRLGEDDLDAERAAKPAVEINIEPAAAANDEVSKPVAEEEPYAEMLIEPGEVIPEEPAEESSEPAPQEQKEDREQTLERARTKAEALLKARDSRFTVSIENLRVKPDDASKSPYSVRALRITHPEKAMNWTQEVAEDPSEADSRVEKGIMHAYDEHLAAGPAVETSAPAAPEKPAAKPENNRKTLEDEIEEEVVTEAAPEATAEIAGSAVMVAYENEIRESKRKAEHFEEEYQRIHKKLQAEKDSSTYQALKMEEDQALDNKTIYVARAERAERELLTLQLASARIAEARKATDERVETVADATAPEAPIEGMTNPFDKATLAEIAKVMDDAEGNAEKMHKPKDLLKILAKKGYDFKLETSGLDAFVKEYRKAQKTYNSKKIQAKK